MGSGATPQLGEAVAFKPKANTGIWSRSHNSKQIPAFTRALSASPAGVNLNATRL